MSDFDVPWTHYRAQIAALSRSRGASDEEMDEARRNLRATRLADYIRRTVEEAPPLTPEQRDRLAILLRGGPIQRAPLPETEAQREAREEAERRAAERERAERLAREVMACDVCGAPPQAHGRSSVGPLGHAWEPGRADRVLRGEVTP